MLTRRTPCQESHPAADQAAVLALGRGRLPPSRRRAALLAEEAVRTAGSRPQRDLVADDAGAGLLGRALLRRSGAALRTRRGSAHHQDSRSSCWSVPLELDLGVPARSRCGPAWPPVTDLAEAAAAADDLVEHGALVAAGGSLDTGPPRLAINRVVSILSKGTCGHGREPRRPPPTPASRARLSVDAPDLRRLYEKPSDQ